MTLEEIGAWLKDKEERAVADSKQFLEEHLPVIADTAQKLAANPVAISILRAEHLSPAFLTAMAAAIDKAEEDLAAADAAQKAAEAAATPAPAPEAEQPAPVG